MLDCPYLKAWDLGGKECVVEIEKVVRGEVVNQGGKKNMPFAHFVGKTKPLGLNSTNCRTIIALIGTPHVEKWPGHKITIYPTTTNTRDGVQECIRVKNSKP